MNFIDTYRELNWEYLIEKFDGKNAFIHQTTTQLIDTMDKLMDLWEIGQFSFEMYQYIIYNVRNVWVHYKEHYVGDTGYDMEDLLIDMTYL
jgi:hypothetical protein